jgi:NAD(P)-dependent dehydrogenase (short-subunit alcohol dehydrogenase family)
VLVNNAAINPPTATILQDTLKDWRRTIEINLEAVTWPEARGPAYGAAEERTDHPHRLDPGVRVEGTVGAYNAAKGGIIALTKSMAVELGPYDILNAVAPGFMLTPMSIVDGVDETKTPDFIEWYVNRGKVPLRRTGYPEDVSGTVIFLASSYCRYMTGQLLVVDGGLMSTF